MVQHTVVEQESSFTYLPQGVEAVIEVGSWVVREWLPVDRFPESFPDDTLEWVRRGSYLMVKRHW